MDKIKLISISQMRFWLVLIISNLGLICYSQTATTIYTPRGSIVPDTYFRTELTPPEIAGANAYVDVTYPLATRLTDASRTYNCHAYAWHMTEGGNSVWMGLYTATAEDIY